MTAGTKSRYTDIAPTTTTHWIGLQEFAETKFSESEAFSLALKRPHNGLSLRVVLHH